MREIRQSGSEGGAAFNSPSLPLSFRGRTGEPARWDSVATRVVRGDPDAGATASSEVGQRCPHRATFDPIQVRGGKCLAGMAR